MTAPTDQENEDDTKDKFFRVRVTGLSEYFEDEDAGTRVLKNIFSRFGNVDGVDLPSLVQVKSRWQLAGYIFDHFFGIEV